MIPLKMKPVSQQSETPKLTIDMAEQIANMAARKAAEETSSKNMESFNKYQEQNRQQENIQQENIQQNKLSTQTENPNLSYEGEGGYSIDTKTEKNLMRRLLDQTLQRALEPPAPNPIETAVSNVMSQVAEGIAGKMLGNISGSSEAIKKSNMIIDILNTAAAHGFGESLGANIPQAIQSLTGVIGQQKAQELASAATKAMSQQSGQGKNESQPDSSNVEKQKDMVLELDINNPEHIKQYASAMGLSEKAAKGMLQMHQDDILTERKTSGKNLNVSNNENEVAQALGILIQEMTGMKETINNLQNKIVTLEGGKVSENPEVEVDTDSMWNDENEIQTPSVNVTNKSVTLFKTPISVDLDDIKGNTNSFFDEPKQEIVSAKQEIIKSKESVLEEVVDSEGKSTFKMSGEENKKKEFDTNEITNKNDFSDTNKNVNNTNKNVVNNKNGIDDENIIDDETINKNIENVENVKVVDEITKIVDEIPKNRLKKIIRKRVPILIKDQDSSTEQQESLTTQQQEHYDINNNLIMENKI